MRFTMRHTINTDEETFWRLFFEPHFVQRMFVEGMEIRRYEVLELREEPGGNKTRRIQALPMLEPPAAVKKILGEPVSIEEGHYDAKTRRWLFKLLPPTLTERISITGDLLIALGRKPGTSDRLTNVEIKVSIFGIGSLIESFIEKVVRDSFEKSAAFMNREIAKEGLGPQG